VAGFHCFAAFSRSLTATRCIWCFLGRLTYLPLDITCVLHDQRQEGQTQAAVVHALKLARWLIGEIGPSKADGIRLSVCEPSGSQKETLLKDKRTGTSDRTGAIPYCYHYSATSAHLNAQLLLGPSVLIVGLGLRNSRVIGRTLRQCAPREPIPYLVSATRPASLLLLLSRMRRHAS